MDDKSIKSYIIDIVFAVILLVGGTIYWYFNIRGQDNLEYYNIQVVNNVNK